MISWSNSNTGTAGGEVYGFNAGGGVVSNSSSLYFAEGVMSDGAFNGIYQAGATENTLLARYFRFEYYYAGGSAPTFDLYYNLYVD